MVKNILVLLLFSSFMFGLDLNLNCSSINTSKLFQEYKKLSQKAGNLLERISDARRKNDNNLSNLKK